MSTMLTLFFEDPAKINSTYSTIYPKVQAQFSGINKRLQEQLEANSHLLNKGMDYWEDDTGWEVIHNDRYGTPLTYINACDLVTFMDLYATAMSVMDVGVYGLVKSLPDHARVILYWQ